MVSTEDDFNFLGDTTIFEKLVNDNIRYVRKSLKVVIANKDKDKYLFKIFIYMFVFKIIMKLFEKCTEVC